MKRFILSLLLCMASVLAFAAPSPKQIEAALAARDYASAKTMISQVLAERPDSARAHLMKAYVLAASDKNKEAAKAELAIARTLDKTGDVVNSPLFGRTVGAIDSIQVAQVAPPVRAAPAPAPYVAPQVAAPVAKESGHSPALWIFLAILLAGGVGCAVYMLSRRKDEELSSYQSSSTSSYTSTPAPAPAPRSYSAATEEPAYRAPRRYAPMPPAPAPVYGNSGMGYGNSGMSTGAAMATGAVAGVAGAVVIDTMVENARLRERERMNSGSGNTWAPSPAPAPYVPPTESRVDYVDEAQSFSSSRSQDDSWAPPPPAPSPAPAPSDWSSSSSSSDSGSWGSSDSGSSSSGSSDW